MTPEQFSEFRHSAVHELMRLNERCKEEFHIFVLAAVGLRPPPRKPHILGERRSEGCRIDSGGRHNISFRSGWANDSLPPNATKDVTRVREFGQIENIAELIKSELPDDEYLGWGMTAVAAKLLAAKGAYRCPDDDDKPGSRAF